MIGKGNRQKAAGAFDVNPLSDALLPKASREIMIPLMTADRVHLLSPQDFREIFQNIRGLLRDMEFELGRWEGGDEYYKALARMADLIRHTNEATKFIRDRASEAARVRRRKEVPRWGVERMPVDSEAGSSPSRPESSYSENETKLPS